MPGDSNPTHHLCGRRAELRFTVHRPASAEVSPCCHRPSGGDVTCSVPVGVARRACRQCSVKNPASFSGGSQPVTRHTGNLAATTDKSSKGEAASSPLATASTFHLATTK